MPEISVIVPIYNVEKYLRRCIDSILAQSFVSFELILINDGSKDNSGKICDEYKNKDERITVIHQENKGVSEARNAGIEWVFKNSDSEWINFIDSDDWVHPDYLKDLYETATECDVTMSICNCLKTPEFSVNIEKSEKSVKIFSAEDFWCFRQYGSPCTKLFRKSDLSDIRFPKGLLYEDVFVTYRLIFKQEKVAYIDNPLYFYYTRPGSTTQSAWTPKVLPQLKGSKQQLEFFKKNGYNRAYDITVVTYVQRIFSQLKEAQKQKAEFRSEYLKLSVLFKFNLLKYHKYFPVKKNVKFYRQAFPIFTKIYKKFTYLKERNEAVNDD